MRSLNPGAAVESEMVSGFHCSADGAYILRAALLVLRVVFMPSMTVVCVSPNGLQSGSRFPIGLTKINCVATDRFGVSTPLWDVIFRTMPQVKKLAATAEAAKRGAR